MTFDFDILGLLKTNHGNMTVEEIKDFFTKDQHDEVDVILKSLYNSGKIIIYDDLISLGDIK